MSDKIIETECINMEKNNKKITKRLEKENIRDQRIIDTAFHIFVERKIEPVSMGEIAEAAGIGRATLFRCYSSKLKLAIAVCAAKWKTYLDELDAKRPISSIEDVPAIDRFIFTMDSYIDMYQHHKELLQYNDNFNHYVTHEGAKEEQLYDFHRALHSANTRFHLMYEKTKEDKTFRTDIPEDIFFRVTLHSMMAACAHYAGGFIWGAEDNKDYTAELILQKKMIVDFAKG